MNPTLLNLTSLRISDKIWTYLADEVLLLLLEKLFVLLQELLVLLLDYQLLQGLGLSAWLLGQRGRLGPPQGTVAPHQLGYSGGR